MNSIYKQLVEKKLDQETKKQQAIATETCARQQSLKIIFEKHEQDLLNELNEKKSVSYQLKVLGHSFLDKTSILYSRNLNTQINTKLLYSNKKLDINQSLALQIIDNFILKKINFDLYTNEKQDILIMKEKLCDVLISFVTCYRSCPFTIFSNYFCRHQTKEKDENLLNKCVNPKNVYCFLRRCLMYVLDYKDKTGKIDTSCPLLGGKLNFKHMVKNVKKLIFSLKYDKTTLNTLIHNIKFARITYLKSIKCDRYKTLVFLAVIRWLFEDFIFKLIKASFYVTDTSKTNSQLFYYLKFDWKEIFSNQLNDQTTKNYKYLYNLEKIREINAIEYCSKHESNGFSLGRLLPKNVQNECRIISGCRVYNPYTKKVFSSNFKFITLNTCLNWLIKNEPSLIGFSCVGLNEIKKKYLNFLNLNSMSRTLNEPLKKWNFLKADIQKCFDSIKIEQLIKYVDELFDEFIGEQNGFTVVKYAAIEWDLDKKNLKLKYDYFAVKHKIYDKSFKYGTSGFRNLIQQKFMSTSRNLIIVPIVIHDRNIGIKKLKELIRLCLQHVLIKIHDEIFERSNGILQGSICSRNLCDLYFGRMEKKLFVYDQIKSSDSNEVPMKLERSNDLIMRIVDDYFILCSDPIRLIKIYNSIKCAFELNDSKTVIYFWTKPETRYYVNDDKEFDLLANYSNRFFSWCGLDFDVNTLDVYYNYEKYFDLDNMKTRLNNSNDYRFAFTVFNLKFLRLFNLNANSLIYDNRVNSMQAILRNFIDCFALSAIRFYLLFNTMPQQIIVDLNLQLRLIVNLCYLYENKINNNLKKQLAEYFYSTFNLFKYLCFNVYSIQLYKMNSKKFKPLVTRLELKIKKLNFQNCFKSSKSDEKVRQIDYLINQQIKKFSVCK